MAPLDLGSLSLIWDPGGPRARSMLSCSLALSFPEGLSEERSSKSLGVTGGLTRQTTYRVSLAEGRGISTGAQLGP